MIDSSAIQYDLLALIGADVRLKRAASTDGGEWAGPCPFCGGTDRFRVWPHSTPKGRWWCRQCRKGGDNITYVMEHEHLGFRQACERLGAMPATSAAVPREPEPEPEPEPPAWREMGMELVEAAESRLWTDTGERARGWLHARGLEDATIREFRLGYRPEEDHWGQASGGRRIWVDRGIVIPVLAVDGGLWGLTVRRPVGEPKYRQVSGSRWALFGRLDGKPQILLSEGAFDMMLTWQDARDLVDVATLGSCSVQPTGRWMAYLALYRRILIAFDLDEGGEKGAAKWTSWCARALRVRLPLPRALRAMDPVAPGEDKDVTDFRRAGGDLRYWVSLLLSTEPQALPPAIGAGEGGDREVWTV